MRRFLVVILLLLFSSQIYSQVSKDQLIKTYIKLIQANKLKDPPNLIIDPDLDDNAYSYKDIVAVTQGMLLMLKNNDELARVLGHELGHHYLHHNGSNKANEYAADYQASKYMIKAHYNVCKGAKMFLRRKSDGGLDHPSDVDRYHALGCH